MTDTVPPAPPPAAPAIPQAVVRPERRWPMVVVWLVPIIAILFGAFVGLQAWRDRGTTIAISFKTGEGIEPRKTKIKYKNVDIGEVRTVTLSEDRSRVIVTAQITREAEPLLVADTRFWVVRPRISAGSVTGLGTLLSGSHIGMDAGRQQEPSRTFTGLEQPAIFTTDLQGRQFLLRGEDMGSLDIGSPIYFRKIQVGQVVGYDLDPDGKGVTVKVFVNAPYDKHVNINTRFWYADGFDVTLDANGLKINTQSVVSILLGGLAFEDHPEADPAPPAAANARFEIFADRGRALKATALGSEIFTLVFKESVRGLTIGAPVDFRGVNVGEVLSTNLSFDPARREITVPVRVRIDTGRLRGQRSRAARSDLAPFESKAFFDQLVARGFRAQLKTANLLTAQLYVALDFTPGAPKASIDWAKAPPELPTQAGSLQELQATLASVASKLDRVPFDAIGRDLQQVLQNGNRLMQSGDKLMQSGDKLMQSGDQLVKQFGAETLPEARAVLADARTTLQNANKLIEQLGAKTAPEASAALAEVRRTLKTIERAIAPDAPLQRDLQEALREVARAAQAFRLLADYLERHPESLLRGKKEDAK
ncbi:MAG: MCE family protein [Burkholderiales bacterium]|nr:MCE family protein [Burkholderiales bacterium]